MTILAAPDLKKGLLDGWFYYKIDQGLVVR
jgi:hypothetical protein